MRCGPPTLNPIQLAGLEWKRSGAAIRPDPDGLKSGIPAVQQTSIFHCHEPHRGVGATVKGESAAG